MIDVPRLVGDPDVEGLLGDDVVEDHEVRAQDLVHPAQRREHVQLVLARLALDVRGLRFASSALAGWTVSPRRSSTAVTGGWAAS